MVFFAVQYGRLSWLSPRCITITIHDFSTRMMVCTRGAQRDVIARSLQISESTPVLVPRAPPFAAVGHQQAFCGAAKRTAGTSPKTGVPRVKLDANTRTGTRPSHERRWDLRTHSKKWSAKLRILYSRRGARTKHFESCSAHRNGEYDIAGS